MKQILLRALVTLLLLTPTAIFSQNLAPIAVNDTVYMCGSTVTIYVQSNDTNPDGDSLTLSIYAGSVNGSFTINGNAIDYTPNVGFVGVDTLVYVVCDDGTPELCDTAIVYIHVFAFYIENNTATICNGDSVFLEGAYQTTPGLYTDFFTTIYGCDSIIITTLIVSPPTTSTISADGPTTFCVGDSVILTASPGTSYLWSTGDTTQSITVDSTGVYTVIVSDTNGCSASAGAVTVTVLPTAIATITPNGPTTFCQGDSVMLTANNGASYTWSTGDTTQSITVYTSGTYSVIVDNGACTDTASITITVTPQPVATITPSGPTSICTGDSVTLTASNGASWIWSTGATTQSITVTTSGTYSVIVTAAGGCSDTASITVTVTPAPVATITPNGPTTFCSGDSVTLSASNGSSWLWSTGATTQNITVNTSGTYSVTVANGSCTDSASITITVTPQPVATITPNGPTSICTGDSVTLAASNGASWIWSTGATTQNITVTTSGTYSVIVTAAGGCSDSASITITVTPQPVATITPNGPTTFCSGDSVTLSASNGASWLWSTGATTQTITVDSNGTYSVTVGSGACTDSASITITVTPQPVATITPGGPTTFCEGGTVTLTASNGNSWLWSTGATTQQITADTSGNYSVTVTNANGCSDTASITVVTIVVPVATITPNGPTTFCTGDSVALTASNGTSWAWSTGATTQTITVTATGTYSVIVTTAGGCSDSATINISVVPQPVATITPSGSTTFCQGDSVTLSASNGSSWLWSTGETTQNITVTASGTYSVTVSNGSCTDNTSIAVNVNPAPVVTVSANGPTTFCQGDSVYLAASNASSWSWSTGATSQTILVTTSGNYFVTATDSNGCSATSASTPVNVLEAPVATVVLDGPAEFCSGDSLTLTATSGTSWQWSTGATTQSIVVYTGGDYYVIVTDQCGSDTSSVTNVSVSNGLPVAAFSSAENGNTVTFTNTSTGATSYGWNFGDNNTSSETSPIYTYASPGAYLVTLIASNACGSDTVTQLIDIADPAELGFYTGFSPNGDGHNDFWNVPMLNYYSTNTVTIINRWGNEVWKADNYNNNTTVWNGKNLNGDELPDGTYYFIITYQGEEKRGWVFLKR